MRAEYFKAFDNSNIRLYLWTRAKTPWAVLQIAHGMAEHALRYSHFAEYLNEQGILVMADDHRAFGQTVPPEENGVYDGDVFGDTLRDLLDIHHYAEELWPGLPKFFLGHSYGSFLGQAFIQQASSSLAGAVIMGSSYMKNPLYTALAKVLIPFQTLLGYERPARLINYLAFASYDKAFGEGKNAWLSRDREQVALYNEDPLCGNICSLGFYQSFFHFARLYTEEGLARIPKELPLLLVSGDCDPVNGGKGEASGVKKLYAFYRELGLVNAELKLYAGARHELLNELNRDEVYKDLLQFFKEHQ